jgi:hypothetical protein
MSQERRGTLDHQTAQLGRGQADKIGSKQSDLERAPAEIPYNNL